MGSESAVETSVIFPSSFSFSDGPLIPDRAIKHLKISLVTTGIRFKSGKVITGLGGFYATANGETSGLNTAGERGETNTNIYGAMISTSYQY